MALKQLRGYTLKAKTFITETGTAIEAGKILVYKPTQPTSGGIGNGHDAYAPTVIVTGTPTTGGNGTLVAGVLQHDVVVQVSGVHKNFQTTEEWAGEYCSLVTDGSFLTDQYVSTPVGGQIAYLGADGKFSATQTASVPAVGKFDTAPNGGFVKVSVKIA